MNSRHFVAFLIKQLFHSRLLDVPMIIANSYPKRTRGIIVYYNSNKMYR